MRRGQASKQVRRRLRATQERALEALWSCRYHPRLFRHLLISAVIDSLRNHALVQLSSSLAATGVCQSHQIQQTLNMLSAVTQEVKRVVASGSSSLSKVTPPAPLASGNAASAELLKLPPTERKALFTFTDEARQVASSGAWNHFSSCAVSLLMSPRLLSQELTSSVRSSLELLEGDAPGMLSAHGERACAFPQPA